MFELGTDRDASEELLRPSGFTRTKDLREPGRYVHRVLAGGLKVLEMFYPTIRIDNDSGELKNSWNVIKVPSEGTHPLTPLIKYDERCKQEMMDRTGNRGRARSRLQPGVSYLYLIFDRNDEDNPTKVFVAKYKKTVASKLATLERVKDPQNETKLLHGPTFCWDALIEHTFDKEGKGATWQKHDYTVETYSRTNKFAGEIDANIWKHTKSPWSLVSDRSREKMFTPEELKAIEECEFDLKAETAPLSEEDIVAQLLEYPLNPMALDSNSTAPIFSHPKGMWEEMQRLELPLPSADDVKLLNGNVDASDAVDAKFEEVEEEEPAQETEAKKQSKGKKRPKFTEI